MKLENENRRTIRAQFKPAASLGVAVLLMMALSTSAFAQAVKIGVANPSVIFDGIQETKDFRTKITADLATFDNEQKARAQKLKDQKQTRDMFKVDSPQFKEADEKLLNMSVEFEIYIRSYQITLERRRKKQITDLFDKIINAVKTVATKKGLDLVIADVRPELPNDQQVIDQINENSLKGLLAQRNLMFSNPTMDISNDVIAQMDSDYKSGR